MKLEISCRFEVLGAIVGELSHQLVDGLVDSVESSNLSVVRHGCRRSICLLVRVSTRVCKSKPI